MTLVYAKIIGMFVCGADPRGGGWELGGTGVGVGFFWKSLQKSIVHICTSLISLGGIHMYAITSRTPIFVKKIRSRSRLTHICGPSETWKFVFFINFRDKYESDCFVSWIFHASSTIENQQKPDISTYFNLDPWALGPHHPPIFTQKPLNTNPCHWCHH